MLASIRWLALGVAVFGLVAALSVSWVAGLCGAVGGVLLMVGLFLDDGV